MTQPITNLPVGAKIKLGTYKVESSTILPIIWRIVDKNHVGYPANSITLLTDKIIDLRGFDAKEPSNADSSRANYGNNRYRTSNLRQWLNSGGVAGSWWTAQNLTDGTLNTNNNDATPADAGMSQPTGYSDIPGFLTNFTAQELAKILDTTLTVAKNTVTDGGGSETIIDKVFLLSNTEVGLTNENGIAEGSLLAAFSNDASRISYVTAQCVSNTLSSSKPANDTTAWNWWLRTPYAGYSHDARIVGSVGALYDSYACGGYYGVRPALNLASDILVSDTTDADGAYTIQWNANPTISGTDTDLGNKSASFTQVYQVNDTDAGDVLTIIEKVDSTAIRSISPATRLTDYTLDLSSVWSGLTLGAHSATITVTDNKGGTATRTYTFTKVDDRVKFKLKNPIETSIAAKHIVMSGVLTVPTGATLKIEACNNGFDAVPTWEDITAKFLAKEAYSFINTVKTADKWGVNVRFEILKGTATEQIVVDGFGFSFD